MGATELQGHETDKRRRGQFSLATLFVITTLCALAAWLGTRFGLRLLIVIAYGLTIGSIAGGVVGLPFCRFQQCATVGMWASLVSLAMGIVWWVYVLWQNAHQHQIPFIFYFPLMSFLKASSFFYLGGFVLATSVPIASLSAVKGKEDSYTLCWPSLMSASTAFLWGVTFFAYDVWCRGGFPEPPLPWPIALAIPLVAGTVIAAIYGFTCGLVWLAIRGTFRLVSQEVKRKRIELSP